MPGMEITLFSPLATALRVPSRIVVKFSRLSVPSFKAWNWLSPIAVVKPGRLRSLASAVKSTSVMVLRLPILITP